MNGLDSLVGRLMFVEKQPVVWGRADVFLMIIHRLHGLMGIMLPAERWGIKK